MARIFAIDDVPKALKDSLAKALRPEDEAVLLPSADLDATSGKYENVVFRFDGSEKDVPHTVFSPAWGTGVSAIKVHGVWVDRILADPQHRQKCLAKLRELIDSQTADPDTVVGPHLDGDENDRDEVSGRRASTAPRASWASTRPSTRARPSRRSRARTGATRTQLPGVKAGAGQAARPVPLALHDGAQGRRVALGADPATGPGPRGAPARDARRLAQPRAHPHARGRGARRAHDRLGARPELVRPVPRGGHRTSTSASTSCARSRTRTTRPCTSTPRASTPPSRRGCIVASPTSPTAWCSSSPSENGDVRQNLRNEAHSSLPFSSPRLVPDRDLISTVVQASTRRRPSAGAQAQPRPRLLPRPVHVAEPAVCQDGRRHRAAPALGLARHRVLLCASFARELGVAQAARWCACGPCPCVVAGIESGKLRAALRSMKV